VSEDPAYSKSSGVAVFRRACKITHSVTTHTQCYKVRVLSQTSQENLFLLHVSGDFASLQASLQNHTYKVSQVMKICLKHVGVDLALWSVSGAFACRRSGFDPQGRVAFL
jgi:hypothetical protein